MLCNPRVHFFDIPFRSFFREDELPHSNAVWRVQEHAVRKSASMKKSFVDEVPSSFNFSFGIQMQFVRPSRDDAFKDNLKLYFFILRLIS